MKKCTYCGKEYPDDKLICEVDARPLFDPTAPPAYRSGVCPCCGHTRLREVRSRKAVSVSGDRQCKSCGAKWSPPVSKTAAIIMVFFSAMFAILLLVMAFSAGISPVSIILLGGCATCVFGFFGSINILQGKGGKLDIYQYSQPKDEPK
jgi:hypothetical protein